MRKKLKREYNREKALYDSQCGISDDWPPVEVDYNLKEQEYVGEITAQLNLLKSLKSEVFTITDRCIQSLRYACINISQKVRFSVLIVILVSYLYLQ